MWGVASHCLLKFFFVYTGGLSFKLVLCFLQCGGPVLCAACGLTPWFCAVFSTVWFLHCGFCLVWWPCAVWCVWPRTVILRCSFCAVIYGLAVASTCVFHSVVTLCCVLRVASHHDFALWFLHCDSRPSSCPYSLKGGPFLPPKLAP